MPRTVRFWQYYLQLNAQVDFQREFESQPPHNVANVRALREFVCFHFPTFSLCVQTHLSSLFGAWRYQTLCLPHGTSTAQLRCRSSGNKLAESDSPQISQARGNKTALQNEILVVLRSVYCTDSFGKVNSKASNTQCANLAHCGVTTRCASVLLMRQICLPIRSPCPSVVWILERCAIELFCCRSLIVSS